MGKKLHIRYQVPGTKERELEVSIQRVLCLFSITALSFFYALTSLTTTVIGWISPPAQHLAATAYRPEPVQAEAPAPEKIPEPEPKLEPGPVEETVPRIARAASAPASEDQKLLELPEKQGTFVEVDDVKVATDDTNLSLAFGIHNRETAYVKGYTYGLAKYEYEDGREELVASHPGIDVSKPFDPHRYVAGLSYGARNFTPKTLHFNKPIEPGTFVKAWIVVTRAKEVYIKEVALND